MINITLHTNLNRCFIQDVDYANRRDIRRVTALLAGSRTGSSFLFRALKQTGRFLSPTGEETPFYRRAGVGLFDGADYSDVVEAPPAEDILDRCGEELLDDCGLRDDHAPRGVLAADFLRRAGLQYPKCRLTVPPKVRPGEDVRQAYIEWLAGQGFDTSLFETSGSGPNEVPRFEEPPFIAPEPRLPVSKDMAREIPLLLKTSTNIYRVPFLKALFPNAEFKFILLRRNPAATINALIDGWLSGAFQSYDVSSVLRLRIPGYPSDRFWKFDLPPGWRDYAAKPLAEVAAFQWRSASDRLDELSGLTVRYEDLLSDLDGELMRILDFSGAERRVGTAFDPAEAVASVRAPRAGKWKERAAIIRPLVVKTPLYDPVEMDQWP